MARNEKEEGLELEKGGSRDNRQGRLGSKPLGSNETLDWLKACKATV